MQQKKFFKKVRSSLDGQGKCVKIFFGQLDEVLKTIFFQLPQGNQNAFDAGSQDRPQVAFFKKFLCVP